MDGPRPRLPERSHLIHAKGARIKVVIFQRQGVPEIEIVGNRLGMRSLAQICQGLSELPDEDLKTPANHYHVDPFLMDGEVEAPSVDLTIYCLEDDERWWSWPRVNGDLSHLTKALEESKFPLKCGNCGLEHFETISEFVSDLEFLCPSCRVVTRYDAEDLKVYMRAVDDAVGRLRKTIEGFGTRR